MIMKNYFAKSSVALMVVSAALASCTQEEIVQNDLPTRQTLNISVNTQDFVSEDGSRATTGIDAERTTVFAEGDEMGMYVISSDGTVICNNEKFVYDGSAWKAANELYYWKNADYIVYYPYDESLTVESILDVDDTASSEETDPSEEMTIVDALKAKFAESADFYTQNTAEAYEKADLMLDAVKSPANGTIQFDLAHQFSMVEINVPVRKYKTKGGFEYTAPVSLNWDTPLTIDGKTVTPYSTGKGSFRFIVPSEEELSFKLDGHLVYDEGVPVNFGSSTEPQSIDLASGTCKVYNVTYDKISSEVVTRDLEVGDFYYTDGSIYPYGNQQGEYDLDKPVKKGCIGVIFEVGNGASTTSWTHGSVLALTTCNEAWSADNKTLESNVVTEISEVLTLNNGFQISHELSSILRETDIPNQALNFGTTEATKQYAAPSVISSGWYLPSIGQLVTVVKNLGGYEFTEDNYSTGYSDGNKGQIKSKIIAYFTPVNLSASVPDIWLSATEASEGNVWALECKKNNNVGLLNNRPKKTKFNACPVLSF